MLYRLEWIDPFACSTNLNQSVTTITIVDRGGFLTKHSIAVPDAFEPASRLGKPEPHLLLPSRLILCVFKLIESHKRLQPQTPQRCPRPLG